jgi:hypothetical protein
MPLALHRARVNLCETHATSHHFGLLVALVAGPRQRAAHENLNQAQSFLAPQL